jgi:hypothetical protein
MHCWPAPAAGPDGIRIDAKEAARHTGLPWRVPPQHRHEDNPMSTYAVILPTEKIKLFAEQLPVEYSASAVYINGIFFLMSNKSAFTLCKEFQATLNSDSIMVIGVARNSAMLGIPHEKNTSLQKLVALA